jgi:hypothetical protein
MSKAAFLIDGVDELVHHLDLSALPSLNRLEHLVG